MTLLLAVVVFGCERQLETFDGSAPSLDALAGEVLDALSHGDLGSLERVRLTEREHNEIVWPELPVSAPELNFPVDFAWANIQTRNASALGRIDDFYEGLATLLVSAACLGETQTFETFRVLTDCWVTFSRDGFEELYQAQLFKDVVVRGGGYKIFRYYDEVPRSFRGEVAE
jgi:hypothetical protein